METQTLTPSFNIVRYSLKGSSILSECHSYLKAQILADDFYKESGFKNSIVIEYDGDVIYRAQRRPVF